MIPSSTYNLLSQGADPLNFATAGCLSPRLLSLVSGVDGKPFNMYVDCGHCLRCADKRRNEWSSRMCLHSFHFKHCYFVTLTYGSYDLNKYDVHPFKQSWLATYPVQDYDNSRHTLSWSPSLLRHSHLTKFLKRLRAGISKKYDLPASAFELSYAACGEYGSKHGRPHFHLIVWSQVELSKSDFVDAWGFKCFTTPGRSNSVFSWRGVNAPSHSTCFFFPIGQVHFVDLVKNGSLNWDDAHPDKLLSSNLSASKCFNYVAKYVSKRPDWSSLGSAASRLKNAFELFPNDVNTYDTEELDNGISPIFGYNNDYYRSQRENCGKYKLVTNNSINYEKVDFEKFQQIFGPFFVSSRTPSIGKYYFQENFDRFNVGNYSLPKFCGKVLSFPSYFKRLLSYSNYGLCFQKSNFENKSLVQELLPNVREFFELLREGCPFEIHHHCVIIGTQKYPDYFASPIFRDPSGGLIRFSWSPICQSFIGFKYNRTTNFYDVVDAMPLIDFCDFVLDLIAKKQFDWFCKTDLIDKYNSSVHTIISTDGYFSRVQSFVSLRSSNQLSYNIKHLSNDKQ